MAAVGINSCYVRRGKQAVQCISKTNPPNRLVLIHVVPTVIMPSIRIAHTDYEFRVEPEPPRLDMVLSTLVLASHQQLSTVPNH